MPTLLEWQVQESLFAAEAYDGASAEPLHTRQSPLPLLLTAVHGINHYRGEAPKSADLYTGALTLLLADALGCNAALNLRKHPAINSAWGVPVVEQWLNSRLPHVAGARLLDIHGARDQPAFDVALGTGGEVTPAQTAWLNLLVPALEKAGLKVALNAQSYAALSPRSLTHRIRAQGLALVPLQIEITRRWRNPAQNLADANHMLATLHNALRG